MKQKQISTICNLYNLGQDIKPPKRIFGGLLHIMWRLDTDKGSYAIKQLSQDIDLTNQNIIKNYELSEKIAASFIEKDIPAIGAMKQGNKYLTIIDGVGFLVYPWVDAKALDQDKISEYHVLKIANILAKIHQLNLDIPEITEAEFDIHSNDKIINLINQAKTNHCSFADDLQKYQQDILSINTAYQEIIPLLKKNIVISHGDLDQKNVLWDKNNNPILIDWESARKLNPVYEIVNNSLDWSGITTKFNRELFDTMIKTYKDAGRIIDEESFNASFYGVLGNWINWMVYNIERAINSQNAEQKKIGEEQVNLVLPTIILIKNLMSELISRDNV